MDRGTFLTRMGLGALAGLVPWKARAEESASDAPRWWTEGDWTVVYTPMVLGVDEMFEPHLVIPDCPRAQLLATDVVVVDGDGVERRNCVTAHTATDALGLLQPGVEWTSRLDTPFWVFWPDDFVVLVSKSAADLPIPFTYRKTPSLSVTLPRRRWMFTVESISGVALSDKIRVSGPSDLTA